MKVIGVGVGRTGTLSLKAAVERLGFGPCFHMRNVLDHRERLPLWEAAATGSPVDWDAVFAGYESSVDWPGAAFWRELTGHYPRAKVILTVRDPERWYDSVRETIYQLFGGGTDSPLANEALRRIPGIATMHAFNRKLVWDGPFLEGRFDDRGWAIRAFLRHNAAVREEIPPERLLVFEVSEGWRPLCDFLGVEQPDDEFPRLNDPAAFWGRVQDRLAEGAVSPHPATVTDG
ncbi:MAG TPA: sulfotransferase [Jiangellaceae bacterium]|nr:sulfotransferase [Jiangellaceae bacterium]